MQLSIGQSYSLPSLFVMTQHSILDVGDQTATICLWRRDHEQWAGPSLTVGESRDSLDEAVIIAKAAGISGI